VVFVSCFDRPIRSQGQAQVLQTQIVQAQVTESDSQQRRGKSQPVVPAQSHTPPTQLWFIGHVTPQPPQLVLVLSALSQPLAILPSQLPQPALHVAIAQLPVAQVAVALVLEQLTPQPPQLVVVLVGVSQPFEALPSQLAKPALHAPSAHEPAEHSAAALAKEHTRPHIPQLDVVPRLASHPSAPLLLQSAKPPLQANPQADALHVVDALGREAHPLPHVEQCEGLLVVLVSQPFAGFPSQLPKPPLQLWTWQLPPPHVATPFATAHALPHAPQWVVLLSAVSQPLAMLPSQLPKPVVQPASAHIPALQDALPLAKEHALPHIPQCVVLLSEVSQPLAMLPSQSPKPLLHVYRQPLIAQLTVALGRAAHALPQAPQLDRSDVRLTHAIPQRVSPLMQPLTHVPLVVLQMGVAPEHARPHAPQFIAVLSDVSQPLAMLPSQLAKSALHDPMRQAPPAHAAVPLAIAQALPHAPQLATSVAVSTHAPPQRVCPEGHPVPHAPPPQMGVAPLQRRPHIPQWVSLLSGVSQPLAAIMSQSPKPAWHAYWHCPAALHEGTMFGRGPHDPHDPPH
jgi:hypothetical protein